MANPCSELGYGRKHGALAPNRLAPVLSLLARVVDSRPVARLGAVQAIVAAPVFIAGLVGGIVAVLANFPTGWAVLTAAGAFMLALNGLLYVRQRSVAGRDLDQAPIANGDATLPAALASAITAGEQLLRDARNTHALATPWDVDKLMRRGNEWYERVAQALYDHGEVERRRDWTRLETIWTAGRPTRQDGADVKACIVDRLWQRVEVLERYAREIENGDPPGRTDWQ
jgi:hypothetical protein